MGAGAQAFDLAGIANTLGAPPSRSLRRGGIEQSSADGCTTLPAGDNDILWPYAALKGPIFHAGGCVHGDACRRRFSFAPMGLARRLRLFTHDLRRGLRSFAASRLAALRMGMPRGIRF